MQVKERALICMFYIMIMVKRNKLLLLSSIKSLYETFSPMGSHFFQYNSSIKGALE